MNQSRMHDENGGVDSKHRLMTLRACKSLGARVPSALLKSDEDDDDDDDDS